MNHKYPLAVLFILSLFLAACKKDNQQKNTKTVPSGVYIVGTHNDTAVFWKDGVVNKLPQHLTASKATGIYVTDQAIYICGVDGNYAALWVNGVETKLAGEGSQGSSVFVSGSDVYVAGLDNGVPVYWKNGKEITLNLEASATGDYVYGIYVASGNVYVSGAEYFGQLSSQYATPVIWKNGTPTKLLAVDDRSNAFAWSVSVSGNDVYAVGGVNDQAVLWKNGVETVLSPIGYATSVFTSGSDVYVAGLSTTADLITCWKNGVPTTFAGGDTGPGPPAVFASNGNVYVSGTVDESYGSLSYSAYWTNGKQTNISELTTNELYIDEVGTAAAAIFVKQ